MKLKYPLIILFVILGSIILIFKNQVATFLETSFATINALSIMGTVVTIASFVYALYERDMRQKLEEKRRSQLWSTIDRAQYTIFDHKLIKEIERELSHSEKHRLWLTHQSASDLYISLVEQYLSILESFTYKDLENLCLNRIIFWRWQERQWRILISQRPENKNVKPPKYFTNIKTPSFSIDNKIDENGNS